MNLGLGAARFGVFHGDIVHGTDVCMLYIYIYDNIIYIYTKGDRTCNIRTCIDTYHI